MANVRIGIDVGGTFTHAVAISDRGSRLIGQSKVKTTHNDPLGVARGVILSLRALLKQKKINVRDISLVAHSTTQATNALLEGDVAPVGVLTLGSGFQGYLSKLSSGINDVKLWNNKKIKVFHRYFDTSKGIDEIVIELYVRELKSLGAKALVVAEAFSTEDSDNELKISVISAKLKVPCTATSDISGLYGLRARTRTAIINASILSKMTDAAEKTEKAIRALKIKAPVMVVRSDGGILDLKEMKKKPILTILSGPAAGVGAALFYERISDGVFIEVGGTSTDISMIKDGAAQIRPAVLGPHRIHLKTLDVKTLGIAGGSLPRLRNGRLIDAGPRSAHIAGLEYASFSDIKDPGRLRAAFIAPKKGDPDDYLSLTDGKKAYALTTTCAANYLGLVGASDWAYGKQGTLKRIFKELKRLIGMEGGEFAVKVLDTASKKLESAVNGFIREYSVDRSKVRLIGGGGGASVLVPYLAKKMGVRCKLARDHEVISAIGTALSMLHETVERSIPDPREEDILRVKMEAQDKVVAMGALPGSVRTEVEIDRARNIVRASSFGSLKMEKRRKRKLSVSELKDVLIREGRAERKGLSLAASTRSYNIFKAVIMKQFLFMKKEEPALFIMDTEGGIARAIRNADIKACRLDSLKRVMGRVIEGSKRYGDAGMVLPKITVVLKDKIIDLSRIPELHLMETIINSELEAASSDLREKVVIIWKLG